MIIFPYYLQINDIINNNATRLEEDSIYYNQNSI